MTDPVDLLFQFSPAPHVAVLTGTGCANSGEANLGDVVVVTTSQPSLYAEVEHMIEVWKLQNETLVPEHLKPPQSVFQQMVCLARIYTEVQVEKSEGVAVLLPSSFFLPPFLPLSLSLLPLSLPLFLPPSLPPSLNAAAREQKKPVVQRPKPGSY